MTAGRRFTIPAPSTAEPGTFVAARVHARGGRACVYCGARDVPLEVDHIRPRAHFAATAPAATVNAPTNLVTACAECNQAKGPQNLAGFATMLRGRGLPAKVVAAAVRRVNAVRRRPLHLTLNS